MRKYKVVSNRGVEYEVEAEPHIINRDYHEAGLRFIIYQDKETKEYRIADVETGVSIFRGDTLDRVAEADMFWKYHLTASEILGLIESIKEKIEKRRVAMSVIPRIEEGSQTSFRLSGYQGAFNLHLVEYTTRGEKETGHVFINEHDPNTGVIAGSAGRDYYDPDPKVVVDIEGLVEKTVTDDITIMNQLADESKARAREDKLARITRQHAVINKVNELNKKYKVNLSFPSIEVFVWRETAKFFDPRGTNDITKGSVSCFTVQAINAGTTWHVPATLDINKYVYESGGLRPAALVKALDSKGIDLGVEEARTLLQGVMTTKSGIEDDIDAIRDAVQTSLLNTDS